MKLTHAISGGSLAVAAIAGLAGAAPVIPAHAAPHLTAYGTTRSANSHRTAHAIAAGTGKAPAARPDTNCDGIQNPGQVNGDGKAVRTVTNQAGFGTIYYWYSATAQCGWATMSGEPGGNVWIDRTDDNGQVWTGWLGSSTIPPGGSNVGTPEFNDHSPYKERACGVFKNGQPVYCTTGWY
jgi:hypothetical protein